MFPLTICSLVAASERGPPPLKPTLKGYQRLFQYPPIGIACVNTAILYSLYFCAKIQLAAILSDKYHWPSSEVGARYIVVGVAMVIRSIFGGYFSDWWRKIAVQAVRESNVQPEARLNEQTQGLILSLAGLIMFGFFVEYAIYPAAILISTFLSEYVHTFQIAHSWPIIDYCSQIRHVLDFRGIKRFLNIMRCLASSWCFCVR